MRPRPLYLALLCLVLFVLSCSNSDKPTELVTSPGDVLRDAVGIAVNTCPTVQNVYQDIVEDAYKPTFHPSVSDPDEEDIYHIIVTQDPLHGFYGISPIEGNPDHMFYMSDPNYCGLDSLQYKVNDGTCDSNVAWAVFTIECENDCPTGQHENIQVNQGGSVNFQLYGNDPDDQVPGGGDDLRIVGLQYSVAQAPSHGILVVNGTSGAASYTPAAGYSGPDVFTYTVSDGECTSSPYTFNINVVPLVVDSDDDGVPDADDDCDSSNTSSSVSIDGCDSGVANPVDANGCSLADKVATEVAAATASASNHGKFVSSMAKRLNAMVADGTITPEQKEALMHCVGSSSYNKAQ